MAKTPVQRAQSRVERAQRELNAALEELGVALEGHEAARTHLSLPEAILSILATAGGEVATRAIYDALVERDALPGGLEPMKNVRVALSRLVTRGKATRIRDGVYRLPAESSNTGSR